MGSVWIPPIYTILDDASLRCVFFVPILYAIIVPKDSSVEITMGYRNRLKLTDEIVSDFDTVVSENEHLGK